ncbi:MAG TPA: HEAT repeat domain-containing protein [Thermoanaerobaculia bacterium]|nr:HEAT repeat domain-containing protein [Thermoanaerobaculia bacterium]
MKSRLPVVLAAIIILVGGCRAPCTQDELDACSRVERGEPAAKVLGSVNPTILPESLERCVVCADGPGVRKALDAAKKVEGVLKNLGSSKDSPPNKESQERLREGLASENQLVRMDTLIMLGEHDLNGTLKATGDSSWFVRWAAIDTLTKHHTSSIPQVVPALTAALRDEDCFVRYEAFAALQRMNRVDTSVAGAILDGLNHPATVVLPGKDTLPNMTSPKAQAIRDIALNLIEQRESVARGGLDVLVFADALEGIGTLRSEHVPGLITALNHAHVQVRVAAARALGRMKADARDALPALREAQKAPKAQNDATGQGPMSAAIAAAVIETALQESTGTVSR